jgi:hypothetical protein
MTIFSINGLIVRRNQADFFWKIRISQTVPRYPRNPIFWKNRISQTVPRYPRNPIFLEKSDFSKNRAQGAQEIFWKNRISKTVPRYPRNPIFLGKIGFLKPCQGTQEIRFFGKIGFLKLWRPLTWPPKDESITNLNRGGLSPGPKKASR